MIKSDALASSMLHIECVEKDYLEVLFFDTWLVVLALWFIILSRYALNGSFYFRLCASLHLGYLIPGSGAHLSFKGSVRYRS